MGRLTVNEFQEELSSIFGSRGISPERTLRWLNFAVLELAGRFDFEELKALEEFTLQTGFNDYDMTVPFLGFIYVVDRDNKTRLRKIAQQDIALEETDEESWGRPERWSHRNHKLLLFPYPDDAYDFEVFYTREPPLMDDGDDKTPFPAMWDSRVLSFAKAQGHLALGEVAEAKEALAVALGSMENTRTDDEWLAKTPHPGLQVAWSLEDIIGYGPQQ